MFPVRISNGKLPLALRDQRIYSYHFKTNTSIYTGVYTKHITHIVIRTGSKLISDLLGALCIMYIFHPTPFNPRQNITLNLFSRQNCADHVRCFTPRHRSPSSPTKHNKACVDISRLVIWENIPRSTDTHVPLKYYDAIVCPDHTNLDRIHAYFE